jgi:hypothetical protein
VVGGRTHGERAERSLGQKTGCSFVEGVDGDDCFQAEDTVVDQQQAQSPTSVLSTEICLLPSVRDEKRKTCTGLRHTILVTH